MNYRMWSPSAKELRDLLVVLTIVTWGLVARDTFTAGMNYRSGTIKGADFLHFYVIGSLVREGRTDLLYDVQGQRAEQERLVPASKGIWYLPVNGPQLALLFAGLAWLPYLHAALLWALLNMGLYATCVWLIWRQCPSLRADGLVVALAALGFPPFHSLVLHGQTSVLPLLCATVGFLALRSGRPWWAGVALGSMVVKPPLGVAVAVVMLACREWRVVGGAMAGNAAQFGLPALVLGTGPLLAYFRALREGSRLSVLLEPKPFQMHSLRAFWTLLLSAPLLATALYLLSSAAVLALTIRLWRSSAPLEIRYSALVLSTILVSPHVGYYELVLLVPAFILTAAMSERLLAPQRRIFRVILGFAYLILMPGALAAVTRVQFSVLLLVTWLSALCWIGSKFRVPSGSGETFNARTGTHAAVG
jgi:hypothetical protein